MMISNNKLEYIYKIIINYLFLLRIDQDYFESTIINSKLFTIGIVSNNYAKNLEIKITFKKEYDDIWYFNFLYRGQNVIIENISENYVVSYHDAVNALYIGLMVWANYIKTNNINKAMDFLIEIDEY